MLSMAIDTLTKRCIKGIEADRERCLALAESSISLVTALLPALGYETATRIARRALAERRKIAEVVLEEALLTETELNELLRLDSMTRPSRLAAAPRRQKAS
jgi:aspartate ammonia-lyase